MVLPKVCLFAVSEDCIVLTDSYLTATTRKASPSGELTSSTMRNLNKFSCLPIKLADSSVRLPLALFCLRI